MHTPLTRRIRIIIIAIAVTIALMGVSCEGGAPGREVCIGQGCDAH